MVLLAGSDLEQKPSIQVLALTLLSLAGQSTTTRPTATSTTTAAATPMRIFAIRDSPDRSGADSSVAPSPSPSPGVFRTVLSGSPSESGDIVPPSSSSP